MRIVAVSDLHGNLPATPECDLLIVAGDVAPDFRGGHGGFVGGFSKQETWLLEQFNPWLKTRPGSPCIVGIAGNHDFGLERNPHLARSLSWNYLLNEAFSFDGLKLYGIPFVPNLSRWAFHAPDHMLDYMFLDIPWDTDILISHGPPLGYCDKTVPRYGSVNAGFPGALRVIDSVHPQVVVCGHIHEGYGLSGRGRTQIANVSLVNVDYEPVNAPLVMELGTNGLLTLVSDFPLTQTAPPSGLSPDPEWPTP